MVTEHLRNLVKRGGLLRLSACAYLIYLVLTASGFVTNADFRMTLYTARNIVNNQSVFFKQDASSTNQQITVVEDGTVIGKPSLFLSILFVPFLDLTGYEAFRSFNLWYIHAYFASESRNFKTAIYFAVVSLYLLELLLVVFIIMIARSSPPDTIVKEAKQ